MWLVKNQEIGGIWKTKKLFDRVGILLVLQRFNKLQLWLVKNQEIGIWKTKKLFDRLGILLVLQRFNKLRLWLVKNEEKGRIWKTKNLFDRMGILLVLPRLNKLQLWLVKNEEIGEHNGVLSETHQPFKDDNLEEFVEHYFNHHIMRLLKVGVIYLFSIW